MSFKIDVLGLDQLLESDKIDSKRITRAIKEDIGRVTLSVHAELKRAVHNKFTAQNDLDKRLIGGSTSLQTLGKNIISTGLTYSIKYNDMSKFPYHLRWGNINNNAKRVGLVHAVQFTRSGEKKVIKAIQGRGGFTIREGQREHGSVGTPKLSAKHGAQMFSRISRNRMPLQLLLGPSTASMIYWALDNDSGVVGTIDSAANHILDNYF